MAAVIVTIGALGVYNALFQAYALSARARYLDEGRAILQTFADQFLRLDTAAKDPVSGVIYTRELFVPVSSGTGAGLQYWYPTITSPGVLSNELSNATSFASSGTGASVYIGGPQGAPNAILATVTRVVQAVDPGPHVPGTHIGGSPNGGATFPSGTNPSYGAGKLLLGTFAITYQLNGRTVTQTLSVLRAADS